MRQKDKKIRAYRRGFQAEILAALYLRMKGYRVLAMRYKTKIGEADIIASRGKTLAVVEVKLRRDTDSALESVTPSNRRRVEQAARDFLTRHPRWAGHDVRFDVIALGWPLRLRHLDNAWQAGS